MSSISRRVRVPCWQWGGERRILFAADLLFVGDCAVALIASTAAYADMRSGVASVHAPRWAVLLHDHDEKRLKADTEAGSAVLVGSFFEPIWTNSSVSHLHAPLIKINMSVRYDRHDLSLCCQGMSLFTHICTHTKMPRTPCSRSYIRDRWDACICKYCIQKHVDIVINEMNMFIICIIHTQLCARTVANFVDAAAGWHWYDRKSDWDQICRHNLVLKFIHITLYTYVYIYLCVYVCMYIYINIYMYIYAYVNMYVLYIYIYECI